MCKRVIEHRRHTMRTKPGQHLSQAGVDLARRVGEGIAPCDLVVTSTIPRAFETALAMGFAVDRQAEGLRESPSGKEIPWDSGFAGYAECLRQHPDGVLAAFAQRLAAFHRDIARQLPDDGHALLISHGGFIEASVVGCLPDFDYSDWGPACNYCEGIRLVFEEDTFTDCALLRVAGTILVN